jgi:hypothetical protein
VSTAIDTGFLHGAVDHLRVTRNRRASISAIWLLSVRFTYTIPLRALTPYSGFPPSGMLVRTVRVRGSMTVEELASPLKVKTRRDVGS